MSDFWQYTNIIVVVYGDGVLPFTYYQYHSKRPSQIYYMENNILDTIGMALQLDLVDARSAFYMGRIM